jgi:hypothetical protein
MVAATVLTLDSYDEATAEMWKTEFGFRAATGEDSSSGRLWLPLFED